MDSLLNRVRVANPKRNKKNIHRRLLKLGEEYGEVNQAYLAVTSKNNLKQKTWYDVREELCDVIIVALDILLTEMPDETFDTLTKDADIEERSLKEVDRKLAKWLVKMITKQTDVDDAE